MPKISGPRDGVSVYGVESWTEFVALVAQGQFGRAQGLTNSAVWRGQRRAAWSLSSSLDRLFEKLGLIGDSYELLEDRSGQHLRNFQLAARGRRGPNPPNLDENEWWALGQHYGLATPLLDWTLSPFAAAFFAFEEEESAPGPEALRCVFGLDRDFVELAGERVNQGPSLEAGRPPIIEFLEPMSNENPRLVSQGGIFSRAPYGQSVERWVNTAFEGTEWEVLRRIEISNGQRNEWLCALASMNIHHASLFPDLTGAARHVNLDSLLGGRVELT